MAENQTESEDLSKETKVDNNKEEEQTDNNIKVEIINEAQETSVTSELLQTETVKLTVVNKQQNKIHSSIFLIFRKVKYLLKI